MAEQGRGDALSPDSSSAFVHAPLGMALCAATGELLAANPALEELLGRPTAQLHGSCLFDFSAMEELAAGREACATLRAHPGRLSRVETRLLRGDGTAVPVQVTTSAVARPGSGAEHRVMVVEDITDRKALEAQLVHRSLHDPLTGLPNRILFGDRLQHALDRGYREDTPTCVLIIDLDEFKLINDAHGHPMGDAVLVTFAGRLTAALRASDTAARLGGDEFAIVCENTEPVEAEVLAGRVRASVTRPLDIGGTQITLGVSIGIGSAAPGANPDEAFERLIRAADDAMYANKNRSR